jgi:hypothetical protein
MTAAGASSYGPATSSETSRDRRRGQELRSTYRIPAPCSVRRWRVAIATRHHRGGARNPGVSGRAIAGKGQASRRSHRLEGQRAVPTFERLSLPRRRHPCAGWRSVRRRILMAGSRGGSRIDGRPPSTSSVEPDVTPETHRRRPWAPRPQTRGEARWWPATASACHAGGASDRAASALVGIQAGRDADGLARRRPIPWRSLCTPGSDPDLDLSTWAAGSRSADRQAIARSSGSLASCGALEVGGPPADPPHVGGAGFSSPGPVGLSRGVRRERGALDRHRRRHDRAHPAGSLQPRHEIVALTSLGIDVVRPPLPFRPCAVARVHGDLQIHRCPRRPSHRRCAAAPGRDPRRQGRSIARLDLQRRPRPRSHLAGRRDARSTRRGAVKPRVASS